MSRAHLREVISAGVWGYSRGNIPTERLRHRKHVPPGWLRKIGGYGRG